MNRDELIMEMIKKGMTRAAIGKELGISATRVTQIYNRVYVKTNKSDPDLEVRQMCVRYADSDQFGGLIYNRLKRIYARQNNLSTVPKNIDMDMFKSLSMYGIPEYSFVGDKSLKIIKQMKEDCK